jgi:hypothetical protein
MRHLKIPTLIVLLASVALLLPQTTKQITLAWDPMPTGESWQAVRIYDISAAETLLSTVPCQSGPPIACPTTVTITIQKRAYNFTARAWDGNWESDNSNIVILAGPPKPPGGLKKP